MYETRFLPPLIPSKWRGLRGFEVPGDLVAVHRAQDLLDLPEQRAPFRLGGILEEVLHLPGLRKV